MPETRKLAAILASDVVGYSRLAGADEDRTLARLRALRSDLIDPIVDVYRGRIVKRTGDGALVEFRSVVDAVRCAIEVQTGMAVRNAGVPQEQRIEFRIGIHLGDVVEESDGDLMGDGVNIAARLEGVAKPGGICLSEDAYRQVRSRLDLTVSDLGETHLKNIAEPVRVYALEVGLPAQAKAVRAPVSAPPLSIVVLPFANLGGDPEQEYFADGVTESLTTDLSRLAASFVIARNTAFTYKGKPVDARQIGRDLNVRYILEGSVQRGRDRLRVNVQLIDTETGNHLWAERFDKPVADLFDMQDEIVARLANELGTRLTEVEARRAAHSPDPDSMDLYFQGTACWHKAWTPENLAHGRDFFVRAVALDPGNIEALAGQALVDLLFAVNVMGEDSQPLFAKVEAAASRVLSMAPDHAMGHFLSGMPKIFTSRVPQGIAELERALALDRNLAVAHAYIGAAEALDGRAEETENRVLEALRLSPRDALANVWLFLGGMSKIMLGRYDEAVSWMRRSLDANRNFAFTHLEMAAALAQLGRMDEARAAAQAGMALNPGFTIGSYRAQAIVTDPAVLAQRERIFEGLKKAGVPEG